MTNTNGYFGCDDPTFEQNIENSKDNKNMILESAFDTKQNNHNDEQMTVNQMNSPQNISLPEKNANMVNEESVIQIGEPVKI